MQAGEFPHARTQSNVCGSLWEQGHANCDTRTGGAAQIDWNNDTGDYPIVGSPPRFGLRGRKPFSSLL